MPKIKVVLVDDHTLFRKSLMALLQESDTVEVVGEADGAKSVIELLEHVTPDVILMDLNLGSDVPDGVEATRRVRARHKRLPVLMLTMYDAREAIAEAARAGASGYVLKDSEPAELIAAIAAVASGAGWLSPSAALKAMTEMAAGAVEEVDDKEGTGRFHLTKREREVLALLVDGMTYGEIAAKLYVSASQIKQLMSAVFEKLGARSKSHAVAIAISEGLTSRSSN